MEIIWARAIYAQLKKYLMDATKRANIVKDISGAGILYAPVHKCFKSTRPVGGYFAQSVTDRNPEGKYQALEKYGNDKTEP